MEPENILKDISVASLLRNDKTGLSFRPEGEIFKIKFCRFQNISLEINIVLLLFA